MSARLANLILGTAIALPPAALQAQVARLTSLGQLRDQSRPLLIFAPKPDDSRLEIQVRTLDQHAAEAHERDLVAIALPYNSLSPTPAQFSTAEAEATRRRFHVAPGDFLVVLVGKDGVPN